LESIKDRARRAAEAILSNFGDESIQVMSDTPAADVPVVSTGSIGFDRALGVGGLPRGRVIEIYGPEASGKTTLSLNLAAQTQKAGGLVAFIDAEHALDRQYAQALGVNVDGLLLSQPDCGEEALEIVESLIREASVELIIIDSVAALVPRAEIEGSMGDHHVGLQARLMSQALRKLTPVIHRKGSMVVFINQVRTKIGVTFGSPETTTGGRALRFYSSVRVQIRRIGTLKHGDRPYGARARVKVVKNKVAPPHTEAEMDIIFGKGINREGELLDFGVDLGLCKKRGTWLSFGDNRLGPGRVKACAQLRNKPELAQELETAIRAAWASPQKKKAAA